MLVQQIVAERLTRISGAENAAPLQDRDDLVDEFLDARWRDGRRDVEAVAAGLAPDRLELVGDLIGRADQLRDADSEPPANRRLTQGEALVLERRRHRLHQALRPLGLLLLERQIELHLAEVDTE